MSVIESRIEKLRVVVDRMKRMLDDPEPGLYTWLMAVHEDRREIDAIMDGQRDEQ